MLKKLQKISVDKDFEFVTVGNLHVIVEKAEDNVFDILKAPLWKLQDMSLIDSVVASSDDELREKLSSVIKRISS